MAHLEGQPAFIALMQRFAKGPQDHCPIDDAASYWDKLRYLKGRTQRRLNKAIGRPATPETAILADVVEKLQVQVEDTFTEGNKVPTAVLSSPDRIRLTEEEISDVFDYVKITNLMCIPDDLGNLYATSAAFAGFGFGHCRNYTDPYAWEREERYLPPQRLLHIDFTLDGLSGTIKSLNSARDGLVDEAFIGINLGLGWLFRGPRIPQLILTGYSAESKRFKETVKDALYDLISATALDVLRTDGTDISADNKERIADDFLFATARGAAEIAKRR
ncbi:MAG: hypothetical protein Q9226_006286 [Calogaya cf. arnoldii]